MTIGQASENSKAKDSKILTQLNFIKKLIEKMKKKKKKA